MRYSDPNLILLSVQDTGKTIEQIACELFPSATDAEFPYMKMWVGSHIGKFRRSGRIAAEGSVRTPKGHTALLWRSL